MSSAAKLKEQEMKMKEPAQAQEGDVPPSDLLEVPG